MELGDFEDYINDLIVSRGEDYFDNSCVTKLKSLGNHRYAAEIEGSDTYEITVQLDAQNKIVSSECDCPYDQGEYCKHEVAVFYELRKMIDRLQETNQSFNKNGLVGLKELLRASSKEDLINFLLSLAKESDEVAQRIELKFADSNEEDELQQCEKLIEFYIARNSEKGGFVAYRNVQDAITGAGMVLGKAQDYLENQSYFQAVKLCLIVIHTMIELLESADDSAGYIGNTITDSLDLIGTLIQDEAEINTTEKGILFELLAEESTNEIYEGWKEWSLDLLNVCVSLAETADNRWVLEEYFQQILKNDQESSRSTARFSEQIANLRYQLIMKHDGEVKAAAFVRENLAIPSFREMAIKNEMAEGNYYKAELLTLEGEEHDRDWKIRVYKWRQLRYEIYKLSHQLEMQRKLALEFVLENRFEYYAELKLTYLSTEWSQTYPQIIHTIEKHKKTFQEVYTRILVEEKEWSKLLAHVKQTPSSIERFYSYLTARFSNEVYDLFKLHIEQMASQASSRKEYQNVTKVIRTFKKAGKDAPVREIVQKLQDQYSKKPAFQDELSKI